MENKTIFRVLAVAAAVAVLGAAQTTRSPFACDRSALSPEARKRHFDELGPALRTKVNAIRELPDGFEFGLASDASTAQLVSEWAVGEHLCCPFFDIELRWEREGGGLSLRLTGRDGVKQFIQADFKRWFHE